MVASRRINSKTNCGTAHRRAARGSTVQAHVSRLRGVLEATGGAAVLQGCAGGYEVRVDPAEIDVHRFETLARCGSEMLDDDPRRAANLLATALDEWRGPALQDLRHVPRLHLEGIRLDELRLATIEARLAAELATGGHVMAVSALQRQVEEHPYREHLRALLMLALYRSGRQVEALRSFQGARAALAEVGVEPGPELRELDEWISCDDPRLRVPALPVRIGAEERRCVVVVEGADAEELVASASCGGGRVLRARATSKHARPYQAVAEALSPLLDDAVGPELAPIVGSPASAVGVDLAYQRFRAFEAVAALLRAAAIEQPLTLVVDNIDERAHRRSICWSTFHAGPRTAADHRRGAIDDRTQPGVREPGPPMGTRRTRSPVAPRARNARRRLPSSRSATSLPRPRTTPTSPRMRSRRPPRCRPERGMMRSSASASRKRPSTTRPRSRRSTNSALPQTLRRGELLVALGRACHAAYQLDAALDTYRARECACPS